MNVPDERQVGPHSESDGFTLSSNGRFAAIALFGTNADELVIVDIMAKSATLLSRPDVGGRVYDPSFTVDERFVVFAWRTLNAYSASEIWRYDRIQGSVDRINRAPDAAQRRIEHPTLSADGSTLYYFGSLGLGPSQQHRFRLFRLDLQTGREVAFGRFLFGPPRGLHLAQECLLTDADPIANVLGGDEEAEMRSVLESAGRPSIPSAADVMCIAFDGESSTAVLGERGRPYRLVAAGTTGDLILTTTTPSGTEAVRWSRGEFATLMQINAPQHARNLSGATMSPTGAFSIRVVASGSDAAAQLLLTHADGRSEFIDWSALVDTATRLDF